MGDWADSLIEGHLGTMTGMSHRYRPAPSTYKKGTTSTKRVHAVKPGTIRVVGTRRLADALCGTVVHPERDRFNPGDRNACERCNAARRSS